MKGHNWIINNPDQPRGSWAEEVIGTVDAAGVVMVTGCWAGEVIGASASLVANCHALIRKIGDWYGLRNHNYISRGKSS